MPQPAVGAAILAVPALGAAQGPACKGRRTREGCMGCKPCLLRTSNRPVPHKIRNHPHIRMLGGRPLYPGTAGCSWRQLQQHIPSHITSKEVADLMPRGWSSHRAMKSALAAVVFSFLLTPIPACTPAASFDAAGPPSAGGPGRAEGAAWGTEVAAACGSLRERSAPAAVAWAVRCCAS